VKHLYLLRHAKSSWDEPGLDDRERPLNKRGRRAAKAMARHLRDEGVAPQLVLCSPAVRTRQTLERIEPALGKRRVQVEPALYGAGVGELLAQVRAVPERLDSVLVIGHNPGLQDLAVGLARPGPGTEELAAKFPTAALATLAFRGRWKELDAGGAELVGYVRPRDLEG
jgi:phosphohistidine phosphatase